MDEDRSGTVEFSEFLRAGFLEVVESFTKADPSQRGFLRFDTFAVFLALMERRGIEGELHGFEVAGLYQLSDKRGREEVRLLDLLNADFVKLVRSYVESRDVRSETELLHRLRAAGLKVTVGNLAGVWVPDLQRLDPYTFGRRWCHWEEHRKQLWVSDAHKKQRRTRARMSARESVVKLKC